MRRSHRARVSDAMNARIERDYSEYNRNHFNHGINESVNTKRIECTGTHTQTHTQTIHIIHNRQTYNVDMWRMHNGIIDFLSENSTSSAAVLSYTQVRFRGR